MLRIFKSTSLHCGIIIFFYVIAILPIFFAPAFVPDELGFFWWTQASVNFFEKGLLKYWFTQDNMAGYGSIYWIIYACLYSVFFDLSLWAMRVISFIIYLMIPVLFVWDGYKSKSKYALPAVLIWLTMPVAWWTGKITGPETLVMGFVALGLHFLFNDTYQKSLRFFSFGWVMLGIAVGIKLTALPVLLFAFIIGVSRLKSVSFFKKNALLVVSVVIGFVIANPFVLIDPMHFISNLKLVAGTTVPWGVIPVIFQNTLWTWDAVLSGGLFDWSLGPIAASLLFITFLFYLPGKTLFAFILGFASAVCLIILNSSHYMGWFWFPVLLLIPFCVLHLKYSQNKYAYLMLAAVIIANFIESAPLIIKSYSTKAEHVKSLQQTPLVQDCVNKLMAKKKYDLIIDYSEVSQDPRLEYNISSNTKVIRTSRDVTHVETRYTKNKDNPGIFVASKYYGCVTSSKAFEWILKAGEKGVPSNKKILIIIGDRLKKPQHYDDFDKFIETQVLPKSSNVKYQNLMKCGYANFYELYPSNKKGHTVY